MLKKMGCVQSAVGEFIIMNPDYFQDFYCPS